MSAAAAPGASPARQPSSRALTLLRPPARPPPRRYSSLEAALEAAEGRAAEGQEQLAGATAVEAELRQEVKALRNRGEALELERAQAARALEALRDKVARLKRAQAAGGGVAAAAAAGAAGGRSHGGRAASGAVEDDRLFDV